MYFVLWAPDPCDVSNWPDIDRIVCGECKALIGNFEDYGTCEIFCNQQELDCTGAWEEVEDTCELEIEYACDYNLYINTGTSDAICQCAVRPASKYFFFEYKQPE